MNKLIKFSKAIFAIVMMLEGGFISFAEEGWIERSPDSYEYATDMESGLYCKSIWIMDRVHSPETFTNLPFVAENGTKARTAVIDPNREKIYVGYSKTIVTGDGYDAVSNDYAHLVIFDLETGAYEKELPLTYNGTAISGLLCANQVGIDDAGNVWICGMYRDICANPAQIYVVEDFETGACKLVGEWKLPDKEAGDAGRIDYWDVVGDITGETSNAVCMGAVGTTAAEEKCCIYRWELAQGATEWSANKSWGSISKDIIETYPFNQTTWGHSATVRIVAEEGHVGSMFYVDGFTTCPSLYQTSLSMVESFASATDLAPATDCNGSIDEFTINGKHYIAYVEAQYNVSPGCRVNICELGNSGTFEGMRKLWSVPEAGLGEISDGGTRIHSIDTHKVVDNNGKEGVYLLTYKCNNGIGLYLIAEEGFDALDDNISVIDGITYSYNEETHKAKVHSVSHEVKEINIPTYIEVNGTNYDVIAIGSYAFDGCSSLISVTIPNSVTAIGDEAFDGCSGLTSVTIGNSVTSIGSSAFRYCTGLTSVTIPNSATSIGNSAFYGCSGLTSVTIGNSVSSIGGSAFEGCSGLTEVNISDLSAWCKIDFGSYDSNPLYYAKKLKLNGTEIKDLVIPNDITEIKNKAFNKCTGLTSVTIPNSVTSIGYSAFEGCSGLKTIVSLNPTPPTCASSKSFYSYSATLYVPKDSFAKYFIDEVWGMFSNIKKIETTATSILLNKSSISFDIGATETIKATISPSNTTLSRLCWTSDNSAVATVDQLGKITAISAGTATITAMAIDGSNVSASCKVTVYTDEPRIVLSQTEALLPVNDIMILTYTVANSTNKTATWSTSNANVAPIKVNSDGSVTVVGLSDGVATITATANDGSGASASCVVTVGVGGVEGIEADDNAVEVARYDIYGHLLSEPTRGINIIKMSDGSTRKEIVK